MKQKCMAVISLAFVGLLALAAAAGRTAAALPAAHAPTPRPAEVCDLAEPNDDWERAYGPLASGVTYRFPIRCTAHPDHDYYYIELETPGTVTMDLWDIPAGADYDLYLYDRTRELLCRSDQYGSVPEHAACPIERPGRYDVFVYRYAGCSDGAPYALSVSYPPPPTPTPTPTPAPSCALCVDDYDNTGPRNDLDLPTGTETDPPECGSLSATYNGSDARLTYNVSASGCTGRYVSGLSLDASGYSLLSLEIKGSAASEVANAALGLRDAAGRALAVRVGDVLDRVIADTWQVVDVPLAAFAGALDLSRLDRAYVQFAGTQGQVRLDSLRLGHARAPLVVDNFNDRADPNALGGASGTYQSPGASLQATYATGGTWDGSAGSLALSYALPAGAWALWETYLPAIDAGDDMALAFYIKGGAGGEQVNLYLADGDDRAAYADVEDYAPGGAVTADWSLVRIPLSAYPGLDLADLRKIKFTFEWAPMSGVVYVDSLQFVRTPLLADSFCGDDPRNSLNGRTGTFLADPPCASSLNLIRDGDVLRLDYDVAAGAGCFAGYYSDAALDYGLYRTLSARVKGSASADRSAIGIDTAAGAPEKLSLRDYLPGGLSDEWQEIHIPLAALSGVVDWHRGASYVVAFEHDRGAGSGTLFLDDVRFETRLAPLWVDNFDDEDDRNALRGGYNTYVGGGAQIAAAPTLTGSYGDLGVSMALDYAVPAGQYAVWETDLRGIDLSAYERLAFAIRSQRGGERPNLYLSDADGRQGFVNVEDYGPLTTAWREASIPLEDFGDVDLRRAQALKFAVEWEGAAVDSVLYLDNLRILPPDAADPAPAAGSRVFVPGLGSRSPAERLYPTWDAELDASSWKLEAGAQAAVALETANYRARWRNASLAMVLDLDGADANKRQARMLVDRTSALLDLACKPLTCWVYVPAAGAGPLGAPNQLELWVTDQAGRTASGAPVAPPRDQWFALALRPSTVAPAGGSMDAGFDPGRIRYIGLDLAAGSTAARYRGKIFVEGCGWQEIGR